MSSKYRQDKNTDEIYKGRLHADLVNDLADAGMKGIDEFLDANVVIERQETSNVSTAEDGFVLEYNRRSIFNPFKDITERESYSMNEIDTEKVERICEEFS